MSSHAGKLRWASGLGADLRSAIRAAGEVETLWAILWMTRCPQAAYLRDPKQRPRGFPCLKRHAEDYAENGRAWLEQDPDARRLAAARLVPLPSGTSAPPAPDQAAEAELDATLAAMHDEALRGLLRDARLPPAMHERAEAIERAARRDGWPEERAEALADLQADFAAELEAREHRRAEEERQRREAERSAALAMVAEAASLQAPDAPPGMSTIDRARWLAPWRGLQAAVSQAQRELAAGRVPDLEAVRRAELAAEAAESQARRRAS